jgi:hypothetical protein
MRRELAPRLRAEDHGALTTQAVRLTGNSFTRVIAGKRSLDEAAIRYGSCSIRE